MTLPKLMRLADVAELLNVSPETVQAWCKAGKFLPARRLGASWVWDESELSTYLRDLPPAISPESAAPAP
jgi:excisionase family DNA binding protein